MDVTRRQIFKQVETIFKNLNPSLGSRKADRHEAQSIKLVLTSWYILSFDCQCDSLIIMERWVQLIHRIQDFNLMVSVCKKYYHFIVNCDIRETSISDFKDQTSHFPLGRVFLKPIWHLVEHVFILKDLESLRLLLCWLKHITKAKIPNKNLEGESLSKWLACEEKLSVLMIDECNLINHMRYFFSQVFKSAPSKLEGFHGNGAVAELKVKTPQDKFSQNGELPLSDIPNMIFQQKGLLQKEFLNFSSKKTSYERLWTSRLTFVPKSSDSMRSICMEPTALMYAEEGVRVQIEQLIKTCSLTKSCIFINDRLINQQRAREASLGNMYATVDLSSASDLVSYQLIDKITRDIHPEWRKLLLRLRSTHALLPNGSIVELYKYAPMGSALCFPIETLVFTSICYATERIAAEYYSHPEIHDYVVFGDDIIFNSSRVHILFVALKYLGFEVNMEKSFIDGCFRESCGGDYYLGHNVTPQYNRLDLSKKKGKRFCGEFAMGLIGLANNALLSGYKHLRYFYIRMLQQYYKDTNQHTHLGVTNDPSDTSKLLTFKPIYTEKHRFNVKLQSMERKILSPHIAYHGQISTDRFLLSEYLRDMQYQCRDSWGIHPHEFGLMSRIGRATVSYSPTWVLINPKEEIW